MGTTIRILVVDDSSFMRQTLTKRLEAADPNITVVGTASDGLDALAKTKALRPNAIILDIEMPHLDGLMALQRIMAECPTPVIMFSNQTRRGAHATVQALIHGAVDCVAKPSSVVDIQEVILDLVDKVKAAASVSLPALPHEPLTAPLTKGELLVKAAPGLFRKGDPVIVMGASTGGPHALQQVLSGLPSVLPAAVIVVQHMPPGFTQSLAQRLNEKSALTVQEATSGVSLARGSVLLAPGDYHLQLGSGHQVILDQGPRRNHVRPSLDVTMQSVVERYGAAVIGVVLTGMGCDGQAGAGLIKAAGGKVIAEHESTSVVYGMPRSVVEAGLADRIVPLPEIASTLVELVQ